MFKEDSKTDRILQFLDTETKNMMLASEEKMNYRSESAPIRNRLDENLDTIIKPKLMYSKLEDYIVVIKMWWKQLKPQGDLVHISRIGDFLAEKNIVSNKHEGMRILKTISNSSLASYLDFEKVFLKAIFKASLVNLSSSLNTNDFEGNESSLRLKLSTFQRYLMMKGSNPDVEDKLGRSALQALGKYTMEKPDISRNKIVKEIKSTVKYAEEKHQDRIKAYLYKIKKLAKEFVNEKGEIVNAIKNTWDIRDAISQKYKKKINTVLDEEQTFDEEKYLSELTKHLIPKKNKSPVERKIKAFRENYIFEKYQKLIKKK